MQRSLFKAKSLSEMPPREAGKIFSALEDLFSPDSSERAQGLKRLVEMDAHRRSPLAAELLADRISEPDMALRVALIDAVDEALRISEQEERAPDRVRERVRYALSEMRDPEVYALLAAAVAYPDRFRKACRLLNACSYAGEALLRILHDRNVEVAVRCLAASAIGAVGFLEAAAAVEGLLGRLSARREGQLGMRFAPRPDPEAEVLLPALRQALFELREAAR